MSPASSNVGCRCSGPGLQAGFLESLAALLSLEIVGTPGSQVQCPKGSFSLGAAAWSFSALPPCEQLVSAPPPTPRRPIGGAFDFQGRVLELKPGAPCEVTLLPAPKDIQTSFWTQWQRQVSTQVAGHGGQPPGPRRKVPRVQYEPRCKLHLFCVPWEQESLCSRVLSRLERMRGPPGR